MMPSPIRLSQAWWDFFWWAIAGIYEYDWSMTLQIIFWIFMLALVLKLLDACFS